MDDRIRFLVESLDSFVSASIHVSLGVVLNFDKRSQDAFIVLLQDLCRADDVNRAKVSAAIHDLLALNRTAIRQSVILAELNK